MLRLEDLHTYYGETHVLHGLTMDVRAGSVVALLGRNGMGKTTTMRSVVGFNPARNGTISFKGEDITHLLPYQIARRGVALVPQGRLIFSGLSVKENLTIGARGNGKSAGWSLERAYSLFPILKERANVKGTLLSGGEQQMLSIARALMTNPQLLLMDEPSEGLSPLVVQLLADVSKQLNADGLTILLVEQNLRLALAVADYVYIVNNGSVAYQSTPQELRDNSEMLEMYLGVTKTASNPSGLN